MSKVLITGATGFTGRYLAPKLAAAGYEVHGTTHGGGERRVDGVSQLHDVDLTDPTAVERVVCEVSPAKVVHLAAIAFVAHSDVARCTERTFSAREICSQPSLLYPAARTQCS